MPYLLAAAAIVGVALMFLLYRAHLRRTAPHAETPGGALRFPKLHRMTRRDALAALLITAAYALIAFSNLGSLEAPQTFHRFTELVPAVTIDLGGTHTLSGVTYYTGSFHDRYDPKHAGYNLELSLDGETWTDCGDLSQNHTNTFHWVEHTFSAEDIAALGSPTARYLRLSVENFPMELGEVCVIAEDGATVLDPAGFSLAPADARRLFDEQELLPAEPGYMNSMYFDEIYHARTAREFLLGDPVYENTHPPLGKSILSLGIMLFGMTPFGWRFMGVLFGVLMVPFVYAFIKNLFGKTWLAVCGTLIFSFEFMHFTQTRIATIDTYGLFFTILMYYFMYRFLAAGYDAPAKSRLVPLALCGVSFGLGIASKWTCFYAAAGLVVLYVIGAVTEGKRLAAEGRAREFCRKLAAVLGVSVVFFVVVGFGIYILSYIPFAAANDRPFSLETVWQNQVTMFDYHSDLVATHSYRSSWWMWLVDARPILYFRDSTATAITSFASFNTPIVSWAGLLAVIALIAGFYRNACRRTRAVGVTLAALAAVGYASQVVTFALTYSHDLSLIEYTNRAGSYLFALAAVGAVVTPFAASAAIKAKARRSGSEPENLPVIRPRDLFVVIGYLAQLLAWIPVTRCTFAYHYFPSSFFLALALCCVFDRWSESAAVDGGLPRRGGVGKASSALRAVPQGIRAAAIFTLAALLLFALFYPYLSGVYAPRWYYSSFLTWFPSWPI